MIQENYLQRDTQPHATKNRKITARAKELNLWERLDGICQVQATQGKCRFWCSCKAWHLDWDTSADKRMRQLIFIHSPKEGNREDMTTIIMNPRDTPPTSPHPTGGSHDGDTDPTNWWNIIDEDESSDEAPGSYPDLSQTSDEDEMIPGLARSIRKLQPGTNLPPKAEIWNKTSYTVDTPLEQLPICPECFPFATAGHGQCKPDPSSPGNKHASSRDIREKGTDSECGPGYHYLRRGVPNTCTGRR